MHEFLFGKREEELAKLTGFQISPQPLSLDGAEEAKDDRRDLGT